MLWMIPSRWIAESAVLYSACLTDELNSCFQACSLKEWLSYRSLLKRERIPAHSWEGISPGPWGQCPGASASCVLHIARSYRVPWGWVGGRNKLSSVSHGNVWHSNPSPRCSKCFFVAPHLQGLLGTLVFGLPLAAPSQISLEHTSYCILYTRLYLQDMPLEKKKEKTWLF